MTKPTAKAHKEAVQDVEEVGISYIRFSSEKQKKGDSLRRQSTGAESYCKRHGARLDDRYYLRDLGMSGFRGKNVKKGALAGFLKLLEDGRIPKGYFLIVESLDRLSRAQVSDALELFLGIIKGGVDIVTLDPERRHTRDSINDIAGLIEPLIVMARAHEESARKSSRQKANWENKRALARDGIHCRKTLPSWIVFDESKGRFQLVQPLAKAWHLAVKLAGQGMSVKTIAKQLEAKGYVTATGKKHWNKAVIGETLRNRALVGDYQPHIWDGENLVKIGPPVPGYYPPVVTETDFCIAQAGLDNRWVHGSGGKFSDPSFNLFTGLLRNGQGERLNTARAPRILPYYRTARGNNSRAIHVAAFEHAYLRWAGELVLDDTGDDKGNTIRGLEAELENIKKRVAQTEAQMEENPSQALARVLAKLEAQANEKQTELDRLRASVDPIGALDSMKTLIDKLAEAKGEALTELRLSIKARIAEVVGEIRVEGVDLGNRIMGVACAIRLKDGTTRPLWYITKRGVYVDQWTYPAKWNVARDPEAEPGADLEGFRHLLKRNNLQAKKLDTADPKTEGKGKDKRKRKAV